MKPLLSIVVPTKDRYKYLKHLISLIDSFNSDEIELVLQDNTSNNEEILKFLAQKKYPYVKYAHTAEQISISDNSDLAILNSTGEYVCFIGDDDGITNHIVDCVKWMEKYDIDSLVSSEVRYWWPDYISNKRNNVKSTLHYKRFTGKSETIDPQKALFEIMEKGFTNRGNLPLVYHGIVKRKILNKIYDMGGTYFPGPSPDIANGVALCFVVSKYVIIDFPVIISGASQLHNGGVRKLKNNVAHIEDVPALPKNAKEKWEKNIPKLWATETVWPESAIKALRYMGRENLIEKVNFEYMLAKFIVYHPVYWKDALILSKNKFGLFKHITIFFISRITKALFIRIVPKKMNRKQNVTFVEYGLKTIEEANGCLLEAVQIFPFSV